MTDLRTIVTRLTQVLALLYFPITTSHATTLVQLNFAQVLEQAELVFSGEVVAIEVRDTGPRTIQTFVTFRVDDVIKGDTTLQQVILSFLGGNIDGIQLLVSELRLPELGEHGFYFVESLHEPMVNPLVGWTQGHFLIEHNRYGRPEVRTTAHLPVFRLEANTPQPQGMNLGYEGVAQGVQLNAAGMPFRPMDADQFRLRVHELLGQGDDSRQHP